jgi:hypothetical protein
MNQQEPTDTVQEGKLTELKCIRRIRLLWAGLVTCLVIVLNDIRYVVLEPNYTVMLALVLYGCITSVFVFELRKTYARRKRLRAGSPD